MADQELQILTLRENAKSELLQIKTIEGGLKHLNKLKSIETWVKAEKKDAELQNIVAEQKLRTQRVLGQLLKQVELPGRKGGDIKSSEARELDSLEDMGLNKKQSFNFQKIASIPEDKFENFITEKKEAVNDAVNELTTAGALRLAGKLDENSIYVSSSLERQIAFYPKPRIFQMFLVDMFLHYRGESEHANYIVTKYYNGLTDHQQKELLAEYKNVIEKYERKKGAHKKI